MTKRHTKPTSAQLVQRIYRHQLAMESEMRSALAMLSERVESINECAQLLHIILYDSKEAREDNLSTLPSLRRAIDRESQGAAHLRVTARTLADHCARLLREKETLMAIARPELERRQREANDYMAMPVPGGVLMTATERELRHAANSHIRTGGCMFAASHRIGVPCAVCGYYEAHRNDTD